MTGVMSMSLPRHIVHPGPATPERMRTAACHVQPVRLRLQTGCDINTAIARGFAEHGFEGGYVRLKNVPMRKLHYVMPAAAPDDSHAAWYSETHVMQGAVILDAGLHAGERDGKPFLHCHGTWRDGEGWIGMGHLLPFEAEFLEDITVEAIALVGALLVTRPDAETNFPLFNPEARPNRTKGEFRRAVLATIRPNTDLCHAVEEICRKHSLRRARIEGIGSLVGADYEDGTTLTAHASELYIQDGCIIEEAGQHRAALDIAMVDLTGRHSHGLLKRGLNPVCVTAELLIIEQV